MKKQKNHAFGKDIYLLGKDNGDTLYWLEAGSWDCKWYWGFGYVETYTNNNHPSRSRDISSHQHFDSLFLTKTKMVTLHSKSFLLKHLSRIQKSGNC